MVKKPEVMRKAPTVRYHVATTIPRCLSEEGEGKITLRLSAVGTTASELLAIRPCSKRPSPVLLDNGGGVKKIWCSR